jgi:hypothetical protein
VDVHRGNITVAVGDWLVAGVWLKAGDVATGPSSAILIMAVTGSVFDSTGTNNVTLTSPVVGDGEWVWVAHGGKLTSNPGSSEVVFALRCDPTHPTHYYAPTLVRIPNGTVSDNEGLEYLQHFQAYPDGAPVGHISTLRGQKLITRGGLGVGNSAAVTGSLPTPTRKMEVFDAAGASLGYVPIYPSIT